MVEHEKNCAKYSLYLVAQLRSILCEIHKKLFECILVRLEPGQRLIVEKYLYYTNVASTRLMTGM